MDQIPCHNSIHDSPHLVAIISIYCDNTYFCNTFKTSEDPCAFCNCETSDMDNLTVNLIQSIAVDADHNTFLNKASDIGISLKTLKQGQNSDPQLQEIIAK